MRKLTTVLAALGLCLALTACPQGQPTTGTRKAESQKAAEVANSISFAENAEIANIKRRLELTSSPGKLGFIVLLNEAGQPIWYGSVKGKVTSGSKRLTAPEQLWEVDKGEWGGSELGPAPSDEGTWGSSSPYIYFWTMSGQYMQWSGDYLYSDQPLRLSIEPLVLDISPATE